MKDGICWLPDSQKMRAMRRRMQIVFQDPYAALNPRMRVREILAEPFAIHNEKPVEGLGREDWPRCCERWGWMGRRWSVFRMSSAAGSDRGSILHGLSRCGRSFWCLDEPVSALDVSVGAQVVNLLRELQREYGLTYLFISHSMPLVRYLCDRVAVMQRGRLVELGDCEQVCDAPREEYTRRLIAATPEIPVSA